MIEVRGSDGQVFQFPDGTAPDVMQRALQQHYSTAPPAEAPAPAPTPPRTMAPAPYFRPEQPAPAPTPALGSYEQDMARQAEASRMNGVTQSTAIQAVQRAVPPSQSSVIGSPPVAQPPPPPQAVATRPPGPPLNPNFTPPPLIQPPQAPAPPAPPSQVAQANPLPDFDMGGLADPNASYARPQPGALPESAFATGGPVDIGMPGGQVEGLEQPQAQYLAQVLMSAIPGMTWIKAAKLVPNLLRYFGSAGAVSAGSEGIQGGTPAEMLEAGAWGMGGAAVVPVVGRTLAAGARLLGFGRAVPAMGGSVKSLLGDQADAALDTFRQSGLSVGPLGALRMMDDLDAAVRGDPSLVIRKTTGEPAERLLGDMRSAIEQAASQNRPLEVDDLLNFRFNLRTLYGSDPTSNQVATAAIAKFDDFIGNYAPAEAGMWEDFRQVYHNLSNATTVEDIIRTSRLAPNPERNLVDQFRRIAKSQNYTRFWSAEERAIIDQLVTGEGGTMRIAQGLASLSRNRFLGGILAGVGLGTGNAGIAAAGAGIGAIGQRAVGSQQQRLVDALMRTSAGAGAPLPMALSPLAAALLAGGGVGAVTGDEWLPDVLPAGWEKGRLAEALARFSPALGHQPNMVRTQNFPADY